MKRGTVILAAGDFPRAGGPARRILESAARVVCCDGAADAFRRVFRRAPDFTVGDLDSLAHRGPEAVLVADQETNDLEKAVAFCRAHGWRNPVVVGAGGRREDHTIGNVFRALALDVELVTEYGRFLPLCGRRTVAVEIGAAVSVFAPDPETRMTSKGLEWPLDGVRFDTLYRATLNRAVSRRITLMSDRPVSVFVESGKGISYDRVH